MVMFLFCCDTLDSEPCYFQEEEREGCLDVNTEYPIVAVITLPSNAVYIVSIGLMILTQYCYFSNSTHIST